MIVVADDDKVLNQLLQTLLEEAGYEVNVAHDGESAYKQLTQPNCKGMILDIRMPGINGAELLMLMAADRIKVPVIVVAGFPDFDEEEMKNFPNVKRFFLKPLYPEEILGAVREIAPKP
jgi:two-component system OmpR family response regulator